ncbi:hypothetical protein V8C86DRAFT_2533117, partial [Haematococcus lacustris]
MFWLHLWSLALRRLPLLRSPLLWPKGRFASTPPPSLGCSLILLIDSESVAMGGDHAGQAETEGEMPNADATK